MEAPSRRTGQTVKRGLLFVSKAYLLGRTVAFPLLPFTSSRVSTVTAFGYHSSPEQHGPGVCSYSPVACFLPNIHPSTCASESGHVGGWQQRRFRSLGYLAQICLSNEVGVFVIVVFC